MTAPRQLVAIYDGNCSFCSNVASWLRRRDRHHRLSLIPIADVVEVGGRRLRRAELEREMHVVEPSGRVHRGFAAWRCIAREVPIFRPLVPFLYAPGACRIGDIIYGFVASHRHGIGRLLRMNGGGVRPPD